MVATDCDTELSGIFEAAGDERPVLCSASAAVWLKISSISAAVRQPLQTALLRRLAKSTEEADQNRIGQDPCARSA